MMKDEDTDDLVAELRHRGLLVFEDDNAVLNSIDEDEMIACLEDDYVITAKRDAVIVDENAMHEAECRWRRGDKVEALFWMERALPDTFRGLADVVRQPR